MPVQRISVVGNSGSGKTTVTRQIAAALDVPHLELDSVYHQPDWQPLDDEMFRSRVRAFTDASAWVIDGNYSAVRDIVWARADTVIWLDPPRIRVMRQVIGRTLRRMATREELWNGNREPLSNLYRFKPEESIIAWAWTRHHTYRQRFLADQADPVNAHLQVIRLSSRAEMAALVRDLATANGGAG
jgi:adenylate kinase family enzyme